LSDHFLYLVENISGLSTLTYIFVKLVSCGEHS